MPIFFTMFRDPKMPITNLAPPLPGKSRAQNTNYQLKTGQGGAPPQPPPFPTCAFGHIYDSFRLYFSEISCPRVVQQQYTMVQYYYSPTTVLSQPIFDDILHKNEKIMIDICYFHDIRSKYFKIHHIQALLIQNRNFPVYKVRFSTKFGHFLSLY